MQLKSILEAILFAHGEPVELERLVQLVEHPAHDVRAALQELSAEYRERGLVLLEQDDAFQMGSHPNAHSYVQRFMESDVSEKLSRSALETVAIVAYKGPLSRTEIDYIRGVNSSFTLRNLLMRGLVERVENADDGRAYRYQISFKFLQHFWLAKVGELPEYGELHSATLEIAVPPDDPMDTNSLL